jgi:hypothetical protein
MPNRRQFIASVAAGLAGLISWRYFASNQEGAITEIIRRRLHYLKLDSIGVNQFAKDMVRRDYVSGSKLRLIDMAGPVYTEVSSRLGDNSLSRNFNHGEERIVMWYLISSDFFRNAHDESRVVRYIEFYEPFVKIAPCSSPFARRVHYS